MTASGTFRTWRDVRPESAFGGKAENIYSERVFRLLTRSGHLPALQAGNMLCSDHRHWDSVMKRGDPRTRLVGHHMDWLFLDKPAVNNMVEYEARLKASERDLRSIIRTIPTMVWSAAPDGSGCGGWRRMNFRGSHDQAQIQAEGYDPPNRSKDRQARFSQATGTCTV